MNYQRSRPTLESRIRKVPLIGNNYDEKDCHQHTRKHSHAPRRYAPILHAFKVIAR